MQPKVRYSRHLPGSILQQKDVLHLFEVVLPPIHSSQFQFFRTKTQTAFAVLLHQSPEERSQRSWETWNVGWWLSDWDTQLNKLNQTIFERPKLRGIPKLYPKPPIVSQKIDPRQYIGILIGSRPILHEPKVSHQLHVDLQAMWLSSSCYFRLTWNRILRDSQWLHKLSNKNPGHLCLAARTVECWSLALERWYRQINNFPVKMDQKMTKISVTQGSPALDSVDSVESFATKNLHCYNESLAAETYSCHPWQHRLRLRLWPLCYCTTSSFKHLCTN